MDIRRIIAVALAAIAAAIPAQAQQDQGAVLLARESATRQFQQRTVTAGASLSIEGEWAVGSRSLLHIDLSHTLTGDLVDEQAHSGAINGILSVALPAGVEFAGEPRLYYLDPASAEYKFMYSNKISQKPWLPDLSQALADASSNQPERIYRGIGELNRVLDKRVTTVLPADQRLQGRNPDYSLAGKSWIIPCNVMFNNLTDLFEPGQSLVKNADLRMTVPVRISSDYSGAEIVAYTGFLSTAVARVTMLPDEIPPGAIILVEQPEQQAPATAESEPDEEGAAGQGEATPQEDDPEQDESAGEGGAPDSDTAEQPEEPAEPEPIEALIYSFEWFSWETTTSLQPEAASSRLAVEEILTSQEDQQASQQPEYQTPAQVPAHRSEGEAVAVGTPGDSGPAVTVSQPEAGAVDGGDAAEPPDEPARTGETESGVSVDVVTSDGGRPAPPPAQPSDSPRQVPAPPPTPPAQEQPAEPQPSETEAVPADDAQARQPDASSGQAEAGAEPGVVEIEPGTLPVEEEYYVVPLKPITGSGAAVPARPAVGTAMPPGMPGTAPGMPHQAPGIAAGQFVPPSDLGEMVLVPEGYFLMGTSNTASAGDADELPQGQVYLPAYYIDKHLVTNRQFYAFVVSSGYKPKGNWDKYYDQGTADMPVRGVAWDDANAYARWVGKRLPTEAEWEKAARGTDGRLYPWGDEWSSEILPRGDFVFNLVHAPDAVSPYGCQSMVGVLWQWTASSYGPYPYNPDIQSDEKVLRGGCYSNGRNIIRCANRYAEPFNVALNTFGFRCARDA